MDALELISKASGHLQVIRKRERFLALSLRREKEKAELNVFGKPVYSWRAEERFSWIRSRIVEAKWLFENWLEGLSLEERRVLFKVFGCLNSLTGDFYFSERDVYKGKEPGRAKLPYLKEEDGIEAYYFVGSALARRRKGAQMPGAYASSHKDDQVENGRN